MQGGGKRKELPRDEKERESFECVDYHTKVKYDLLASKEDSMLSKDIETSNSLGLNALKSLC